MRCCHSTHGLLFTRSAGVTRGVSAAVCDPNPPRPLLSIENSPRKNPPKIQRPAKGASGKGSRQKTSKIVKKCQKYFQTPFDIFRAGQKTSKIVKSVKKFFRHFLTIFAWHPFSGPFWGALKSKKVHPNEFFLNNFCWVSNSHHKKARKSSRELFEKVRGNAVFFGIFEFGVGFLASTNSSKVAFPLVLSH